MPISPVRSPEHMRAAGRALGRIADPGDVVALAGELGAGKTVFVQGLAEGLGVPREAAVTSPTFTLVNEYRGGRLPLFHVDLYRLEREAELEDIGLEDLYGTQAVVAIEWADRFPAALPRDRLDVRIAIVSTDERRLEIVPQGVAAARLAGRLYQEWARHFAQENP